MDMRERLEARERGLFNLQEWHTLFLQAQAYRRSSGWEDAANQAVRIRKNDIPLGDMKAAPGWKGKFYKDNWLWKGIKWLVSMQMGSAVEIDLKSYLDSFTPAGDLLEQEVNWASDLFHIMDSVEECLYDRYYPGMGVVKGVWNTRRVSPHYATGIPQFRYVDVFEIWLDPACKQRDMSDLRYLFHQEWVDIVDLARRYPKWKDKIADLAEPKRGLPLKTTPVITIQYRKIITTDIVILEDRESGVKKEFSLEEWQEYLDESDTPEAQELYAQEAPGISYGEWLAQGGALPEKVVMVGPMEVEQDAVFQAMYIPGQDQPLEPPQYVGKSYSYFFLRGYHEPDCAYSYGLAHYMKDLLEVSVILMTVLTISAAKTYKNEKLIQEDSLANQEQYQERGYELGVNPIVKSEWQQTHPGQKAVENVPLPEFPRAIMMLNDQLVNAQKTMTGAIDAAIGLNSYSGQSGIQVAQLQTAARTYQREDIEYFRRFLREIYTWLKDQIVEHRNYPHQIPGLTSDDKRGLVDVATNLENRLDGDEYYVQITIQDNEEVVKQIERQFSTQLHQMGLISSLEFLRRNNEPNPEKKLDEAQTERGEKETLEMIRQHPELQQMIAQAFQQLENPQQAKPNESEDKLPEIEQI